MSSPIANLGRFNTILTDYETAAMLGGNERDWARDTAGLFEYITGHANGTYDEQIGEDLQGINAVQITTIHQAKGLEWPIVFMLALMSNRFPSKNTGTLRSGIIRPPKTVPLMKTRPSRCRCTHWE